MFTKKQINEIKNHLSKAQNPLFFFDNDPDGLCSFLLLQRFIGRGKGVAIKTFPELSAEYFRKVNELNADYIFVLDKPLISDEFFKEAMQINIPVVWIDHHETNVKKIPKFVNYYNPLLNSSKTNEPVTYLCYKITNKKDDLWIAAAGCISDRYVPDFYSEFEKAYPDLSVSSDSSDAAEIYYNSQLGKIIKLFSFALKDRTSNVVSMLKFLMKVKTPYEILEENNKNYLMYKRLREIDKKYKKLLHKAIDSAGNKNLLFFQYGGDLSISSDLANELRYKFQDKIISVAYLSGEKVNLSLRGEKVRELALSAIKDLKGATGGGHEKAVGVKVRLEDLKQFREKLEELIGK